MSRPLSNRLRSLYTERIRDRLARAVRTGGRDRLLTRDELEEGASEYVRFGDAETYQFSEPPHSGPLPTEIEAKVGRQTVPRPFVCELRDVHVVGPHAIPIDSEGRYVVECVDGSVGRLVDAMVMTVGRRMVPLRVRRPRESLSRPVVSLVGPWAEEYFHWIADYLTRLEAVDRYAHTTGVEPTVLVPADPPSWLTESLALAGVQPARRRSWNGGRLRCRRFVVPSLRRHAFPHRQGYMYSPAALRTLADRLRGGVDDGSIDGTGRIYISRANAEGRHVVNEKELLTALSAYGFERYVLEDLSVGEQVALFSNAEAVVGPHGAGFINLIFADEPTVVELFGSYINACFFAIAAGMDCDYGFVTGEAVGDDLRVDPDAVVDLLTDLLD